MFKCNENEQMHNATYKAPIMLQYNDDFIVNRTFVFIIGPCISHILILV